MGENLSSNNAIDLFQNLAGFFKNVTPESLATFTGTMFKPSFYDSNQPQNRTEEKGVEKERKTVEKKKDSSYHNFYIADFEERQKPLAPHWFRRLNRGASFSKIQIDI